MCGIYGMVCITGHPLRHPGIARQLFNRVRHRGPDGHGEHRSEDAILGAARLWIVDRRSAADQPYTSPSGKTIVCNGEIYNGFLLRSRFPTYPYRSRTDIEPILPLLDRCDHSGLDDLDGMFGLAVWDPRSKCLWLARDHSGEKPLFYAQTGNEVWFASEVHALLAHPDLTRALDETAIADYLAFGYTRAPHTMLAAIRQVMPGTVLRFTARGSSQTRIAPARAHDDAPCNRKTRELLLPALELAVRKQLRSDVPIGVFLSGGIDSSLITALASSHQSDIHSYTVRFPQSSFDEGSFARRVAAEYRTWHHEVHATFPALRRVLDHLICRVAEPLSDPAVLPTILLAQRAREDVGVVLSGEGADELFGGYPTYLGHRWADTAALAPPGLLELARRCLARIPSSGRRLPITLLGERFLAHAGQPAPVRHLCWFGTGLFPFLPARDRERILDSLMPCSDPISWAMETDYHTYLPGQLLPKMDRATMLCGLEGRAPFLDRDVMASAQSLPSDQKVSRFQTKIALRRAAATRLPPWIIHRRKRGLSVPIASWLYGGLRSTVDRVLDPTRIADQGIFPDLPIGRLTREHLERQADNSRALWPLVIFQLWLENWEGTRV